MNFESEGSHGIDVTGRYAVGLGHPALVIDGIHAAAWVINSGGDNRIMTAIN
jgi:hypothetical protein